MPDAVFMSVYMCALLMQSILLYGFVFGRRSDEKRSSVFKELERLQNSLKRGKPLERTQVPSRTEMIRAIFADKMHVVGLELGEYSHDVSVTVPYTKFTTFLKDVGVSDDMIDALLTGIGEAENEDDVCLLVEAAAETPELPIKGEQIKIVEKLAIDEWRRVRHMEREVND